MSHIRPPGRRPENVRSAGAKSRQARLRAVEARLVRRHDPDGDAALVGMLRRGVAHETRGRR
jgi:hypothetical protein